MSFLLRLCLGLAILAPSLVHAAVLEIPGDGDSTVGHWADLGLEV